MKEAEFVRLAGKVLPPRLFRWCDHFGLAGELVGVDAFLLASICDRESRGGDALTPPGPGGTGDFGVKGAASWRDASKGELGHGRGLLQIDDRAHAVWCAQKTEDGRFAWADAKENIIYGAKILSENIAHFARYEMYSSAVRLAAAVAAYNCGLKTAANCLVRLGGTLEENQLLAVDRVTTGGDYSQAVLARRRGWIHDVFLDDTQP